MKSTLTVALSVLSLLASVAAQGHQAPQNAVPAADAKAPKVGVVDFVKVMDAYPRAIEARGKLEEMRKQNRALLEAELKKGRELELKLEDLQRGTPAHDMKLHELRLKKQDIEGMEQIFEREWRRKFDEWYLSVYAEMERAVAIVAKERGLQMVLRSHPQLEDGTVENRTRVYEARIVWFASEEVDITPAVIKVLQVPLPAESKPDAAKPAGETKTEKQSEQR
jgi:Skp family chaperone for outer membrane proteins